MKEILGFAVLTGPLWLILILLVASFWIARKISKRFKRRSTQIVSGIGVFLLIFLVPFGDEIAGRIYLNHLCTTEAGVKVYRTVELPGEYWGDQGRAKFLKPNGDLDNARLSNRFSTPAVKKPYSYVFGIDDYRQQVVDNTNNEILGEVVNFMHWGGVVSRYLSPSSSAIECKNLHGNRFWREFHLSLFKQSNSAKGNTRGQSQHYFHERQLMN